MSTSSDDSTPPEGGARLRAKARVSPRLRPEVADALGGIERSLIDVATWEQLQPSPIDGGVDAEIPPPPGAPGAPSIPLDDAAEPTDATGAADPAPTDLDADLGDWGARRADAALPEVTGPPLLTRFTDDQLLDDDNLAGPVLASAQGIAPGTTQAEEEAEEARRRRRNGRILSWAGVILLVAVVGLWLIPDRGKSHDKGTTATTEHSSTTDDSLLLGDGDLTSTTAVTTPTTDTSVFAVTVPATTNTTARRTTNTTAKPKATTTTAPHTTTTALRDPGTIFVPSPGRTVPPDTTTTTIASTTTVAP